MELSANANNWLLTENILDPSGMIVASARFDDTNPGVAEGFYFYHYDLRGSTTAIVGANGNLQKGYAYDEFGSIEESGNTNFLNEVTFTGSITDTSTGLQYMNARFYDADTGRFISQDSYTGNPYDPWTQHLYTYCGNNPANMVDPTGHKTQMADPFKWMKENCPEQWAASEARRIESLKKKDISTNTKQGDNTAIIKRYQEKTGDTKPLKENEMYYCEVTYGAGFNIQTNSIGGTMGYAVLFNETKYAVYVIKGTDHSTSFGLPVVGATRSMGRAYNVEEPRDYDGRFDSGAILTKFGGKITAVGVPSAAGKKCASAFSTWAVTDSSLISIGESTTYYTSQTDDWIEGDVREMPYISGMPLIWW